MEVVRLESVGYLMGALGLALILIYLVRLRRRNRDQGDPVDSVGRAPRFATGWVLREIDRLRAGEDLDRSLLSQMSAEERALFEVSVIDALNKYSREDQHRLRSVLVKHGYDEQCARRVMIEDLSDQVRACALLGLLRPQWRDPSIETEQRPGDEGTALARATSRTTGPLDLD